MATRTRTPPTTTAPRAVSYRVRSTRPTAFRVRLGWRSVELSTRPARTFGSDVLPPGTTRSGPAAEGPFTGPATHAESKARDSAAPVFILPFGALDLAVVGAAGAVAFRFADSAFATAAIFLALVAVGLALQTGLIMVAPRATRRLFSRHYIAEAPLLVAAAGLLGVALLAMATLVFSA